MVNSPYIFKIDFQRKNIYKIGFDKAVKNATYAKKEFFL